MTTRRRRRSKSLAAQTFELGMVAPQVIAHRVARMAAAGASPSARDRAEFHLMGAEKIAAANEAWAAMAAHAIAGKGMAPIRRRAVANAKRLGRVKRK